MEYDIRHLEIAAIRLGQTGSWFLQSEKVQAWIEGSDRLLWCPGHPGAGKTIASSILVEYLKTRSPQYPESVGFVYLDYCNRQKQTIEIILGSILRRVVQISPGHPLLGQLRSFYKRHFQEKSYPSSEELQEMLIAVYANFPEVYIVVDALDEYCDVLTSNSIRRLLSTLLSLGPHVKVAVTSRNFGCIGNIFSEYSALCQEITPHFDDLSTYIRARIEDEIPFATLSADVIVEKVSTTASTSFLIARLHMDTLCQYLTPGHLLDALEDLSSSVDSAYEAAMERIRQQSAPRRELASKIICWVTFGGELSIQELQHALATAPGRYNIDEYLYSKEILSEVCAGLLDTDRTQAVLGWTGVIVQNIPAFIHFTTYDYFHRMQTTLFPEAYRYLAETCVTYLSDPIFTLPEQRIMMVDATSAIDMCWEASQLVAAGDPVKELLQIQALDLSFMATHKWLADVPSERVAHSGLLDLFRQYSFLHFAGRFWGSFCVRAEGEATDRTFELLVDNDKARFLSLFNGETTGMTGLYLAGFYGLSQTFKSLMRLSDLNRNVIEVQQHPRRSLLSVAAALGHIDTVKAVANALTGQSLQLGDMFAEAFIIACNYDRTEIAEMLFQYPSINIHYKNKSGSSLIMAATAVPPILRHLLERGDVNPNEANDLGSTPLMVCVIRDRQESFKMLLQDHRVVPNPSNHAGESTLGYARQFCRHEMAYLLYQRQLDDTLMRMNIVDACIPLIIASH